MRVLQAPLTKSLTFSLRLRNQVCCSLIFCSSGCQALIAPHNNWNGILRGSNLHPIVKQYLKINFGKPPIVGVDAGGHPQKFHAFDGMNMRFNLQAGAVLRLYDETAVYEMLLRLNDYINRKDAAMRGSGKVAKISEDDIAHFIRTARFE